MYPVVVLAGGKGTRLRPVVEDRPKVLAPVAGKPFLAHLLRKLADEQVEEIVLSTGYLGDQVETFVREGQWPVEVTCVREPEPLGTGGALKFVAEEGGIEPPFIAMNGDTFFSGSVERLVVSHGARSAPAGTVALVQIDNPGRYGTVAFARDSQEITGFREKSAHITGAAWINAGVYLLEPKLLASIPPGQRVSLERDIFPAWVRRGLYACRFPDAAFLDIGTPDDYRKATEWLHQN